MAEVIRFRPVLLGPPEKPTTVLYLKDAADGQVYFRELEFSFPLDIPLEAVTTQDLLPPYGDVGVTILPVQEVAGETRPEAFDRMLAALEAVRLKGAPKGQQERPPVRRGRGTRAASR
ncbi:MAG: hypothetical protein HY690_06490 [Chloroflexi bacterium]|nr:hypothetical protein [Chloroflexota bacterium]